LVTKNLWKAWENTPQNAEIDKNLLYHTTQSLSWPINAANRLLAPHKAYILLFLGWLETQLVWTLKLLLLTMHTAALDKVLMNTLHFW